MPTVLRIELLAAALLFFVYVFHTVNKRKLLVKYSLLWLAIGLAVLLVALFPQIVFKVTALVGIETPSNLIYFLVIVFLLFICFSLSVSASKQTEKMKQIVQAVSLQQAYAEQRDRDGGCDG